jgi:hypothetical protein
MKNLGDFCWWAERQHVCRKADARLERQKREPKRHSQQRTRVKIWGKGAGRWETRGGGDSRGKSQRRTHGVSSMAYRNGTAEGG